MGVTDLIVGRDVELGIVADVVTGVETGPVGLMLEGEAGVGKTTVWNAALARVSDGVRVLSCRPGSAETKLSYSGLDDLFGGVVDDVIGSLPDPQRNALEVVLLRASAGEDELDLRTVARAVLEVVRLLAETGPLVVAVDDVQWLDRSSAEVLTYVLRRLRDERVAMVLTWRTPADAPVPLGADQMPWSARVRRVQLGPLSVGALHGIVQSQLGVSLQRWVLVKVHTASRGNPFYAVEIARALGGLGRELMPGEPLPLPATLTELVAKRLTGLATAVQEVLLAVAALGQPTTQLVEATVGVEQARSAVRRAVRAGVLTVVGDQIEFAHPLLASGVYAGVPPSSRAKVHRRLAKVVTSEEERARHLALATTDPDDEVAATLEVAADVAIRRGSPLTAAELYEHAARLSPPSAADDADRRLLRAARCYGVAGSPARGRQLAEHVADAAGSSATRAGALTLLASAMFVDDLPATVETLRRALREAAEHPRLKAEALNSLAMTHLACMDVGAALTHAGEALDLAEEAGDLVEWSDALATLGIVEYYAGRPNATDSVRRAAAIETTTGGKGPVSRAASGWVGTLLRWADDFDGARTRLEPLLCLANDVGDDSSAGQLSYELSELECWAGNWRRAYGYARDAVEIHRLAGHRWELSAALAALAGAEACLGRVDSARTHATDGSAIARAIGAADETVRNLRAIGFLELSLARPRQALDSLAEVASISAAVEDPGVIRYAGDHIEALIGVDDLDTAGAFLSRLEHQASALDRAWALAVAARCRALMSLHTRRDLDAALASIDEALAHHDRVPMPFERGRTLLIAGMVHRRAKHLSDAHRVLGEAQSTFETLGAPLWVAIAARERRRIGGHLGRSVSASQELTATERQVVELVVAGATNPEVAAALHISRRTVEDHLSKIYRKLGVRSRTELAHRTTSGSETAVQ